MISVIIKHLKNYLEIYNLIDNESEFYEGRQKIIDGFKNKVFQIYYLLDIMRYE